MIIFFKLKNFYLGPNPNKALLFDKQEQSRKQQAMSLRTKSLKELSEKKSVEEKTSL